MCMQLWFTSNLKRQIQGYIKIVIKHDLPASSRNSAVKRKIATNIKM